MAVMLTFIAKPSPAKK